MKFKKIMSIPILSLLLSSCNIIDSINSIFNIKNEINFSTYRKSLYYSDLPSLGNDEILVIPVVFSDCRLTDEELIKEHENIEKTFFGNSEDTYWESLSSYYKKSSYNKLNISGKVSDYFYYDKTVLEANAVYYESDVEPTYNILEAALVWYEENNDDINRFDTDNDNRIDSVWLIYMEEYNAKYFNYNPSSMNEEYLSEFLWAYTYWYIKDWKYDFIRPYSYAWASYSFLHDGDENGTDAHTIIHETGHLFGLEDYYNYDYTTSILGDRTKPCGSLDMMDNNILDHNAYTKYLLNWISPIEVKEDGIYEISSFQENGDSLIIRVNDNNTPFDEYLIIEYYTPTGLNELDSYNRYDEQTPYGFTENGFKIYHVDSRLGKFKFENNSIDFIDYYTDFSSFYSDLRTNYFQIVHSNTPSKSKVKNKNIRLISLLSPLGKSRLYFSGNYNVHAENKDLFQKGDKCDSFTFNSVSTNNISIEIIESNENGGSILITGISNN